MQEYRRNWKGLWTKYRNTEETGQDFGQNIGIQKKLDRNLDKMQEYRRNCTGQVQRMNCDRLLRVMKNCRPKGKRNQQRPLKRIVDV
jgi:hypothetical protein